MGMYVRTVYTARCQKISSVINFAEEPITYADEIFEIFCILHKM